ncbi:hypothetical protein K435DRAFT_776663 [Dendrothele bispora CBS 962.96]|uniref:Uncharacterized protein n=1 Tax=Dendrothele bispora (strain CBS 962.96) TaxID=1314807 RepID=A0A4V4HGV9_DENBC|nr:hypothetical protein K435DRAFT_776663 [Dendrothele bispora CBS 962.96]
MFLAECGSCAPPTETATGAEDWLKNTKRLGLKYEYLIKKRRIPQDPVFVLASAFAPR